MLEHTNRVSICEVITRQLSEGGSYAPGEPQQLPTVTCICRIRHIDYNTEICKSVSICEAITRQLSEGGSYALGEPQQLPTVTCICRIRHRTDKVNAGQYLEQKCIKTSHIYILNGTSREFYIRGKPYCTSRGLTMLGGKQNISRRIGRSYA